MAEKKKTTKETLTGHVHGGTLNIRKEPSISSDIVGELKDGTKVTLLEAEGEWYRVKAGYVMGKWINIDRA